MKNITQVLVKNTDVLVTILIVSVILMMIVPIPAVLMDGLLGLNIALSLTIFLVCIYTLKPLDFSIFPSLLLVATMFRLSLNISTTRLILLNGYAGKVINAFGSFVVGGNFIVGFVIFLILVIVNFVVITQGANRVAEVAARFTLDALPGKQMSIDADLNAGIITEEEAKLARKEIASQADFYGAMDGASKFVKGDAIAGVIIVVINLLGGLAIGIIQKGMDFNQALRTYSLLTIGDGLISQIPALLISIATGLIVTRATSDSNLSQQISLQFLAQPKAIGIAAGIIFMVGFLPGMPKAAFFILGAILGTVAYFQARKMKRQKQERMMIEEDLKREELEKSSDEIDQVLYLDLIEVELGYNLISLVESAEYGNLSHRIELIKKQITQETGFIVPPIRIRDNMQLDDNGYSIKIKGISVAENKLFVDKLMVLNPANDGFDIKGIDAREPVFGLEARWLESKDKSLAEEKEYTIIDPVTVLVTHLTEVIKENAGEIFGIADVKKLLDKLSKYNPVVVEEVIPKKMELSDLHQILSNLLKERIPIKDLTTILETLLTRSKLTKNIDLLTEYVRQGLARSITDMYQNPPGVLSVIVIDPDIEQRIMDSLKQDEHSIRSVLDPETVTNIMNEIREEAKRVSLQGYTPIVLCLAPVRLHLAQIAERIKSNIVVLSYEEITQEAKIEPIGMIRLRLKQNQGR
ncbi:MAG: flagellar biosynthesis protein FlhA [Actinomycetota bacterium]|nr:flagellar biosynthesis protein FlhA [Actinomycetota bacterium]